MNDDSREILFNDAALNALKRHQLQSLTRKHGLKSNGKNSDLVQRLQDFAVSLTPGRPMYLPQPAETPAPSHSDAMSACSEMSSPSRPLPQPVLATRSTTIRQSKTSTTSENCEMLSDSGASFVSPSKATKLETIDSIRSWKSSGNGEKLDDFGAPSDRIVASGSMNSIKSMASSLKRSASQHLMPRSRRNSINMLADQPAPATVLDESAVAEDEGEMEHMIDPPSPASTVGVPRRYSGVSLLERPSTVRLVASPPPTECESENDEAGELPFLGSAKNIHSLKERRSMAPLPTSASTAPTVPLARKSMPAISAAGTASISNIYPPLPPLPIEFQKLRDAPGPTTASMPGAMPTSPKKTNAFLFGSDQGGPSNQDFADAGKAILAQMNARMPSGSIFSEEYLKGKQAGLDRLVKTNSNLGEGGWGFGSIAGPKVDRYADAHQKEFSKMRSISKQNLPSLSTSTTGTVKSKGSTITLDAGATPAKRKRSSTHLPSAPNGGPLHSEITDKAPVPKKKRLSYLGGLKEAGKSLLNLRDEATPLEQAVAANQEKRRQSRRRSSLLPGALKNRFGWLGRKKKSLGPTAMTRTASIPAPTLPRKTSVYAPRNPPQPRLAFDLQASLRRSTTTTTSRNLASSTSLQYGPKQRKASSSAQTVMSTVSSRARSKIPDFAPLGANSAAGSSVNTLGLPKPSSSAHSTMRKQSQADMLKNARPAPAPPAEMARPKITASVTSSRLYAPTASSLARMQATLKPEGPKPMPAKSALASTATTEPFGLGSTRDVLFQTTNFNVQKPAGPRPQGIHKTKSNTQLKSPMKSASSARARAQASGINAVKSRPDMRKEREVHARKAEIKARQDRLGEERELRKLLASDDDVFIPEA